MRTMNLNTLKTRFAPSPTGLIHLGNVRTALFNWLMAKSQQGHFLLRIEDTDQERSKTEYVQALEEDLSWLGLNWWQGTLDDGSQTPCMQSDRSAVYHDYYRKLEGAGLAYPCFCSATELEVSRKVQRASGRAPRYEGRCGFLGKEEVQTKLDQGLKPTLRFRVPRGETVEFEDLVRGTQKFASDEIGDFIIRRADGTPAFFFSNAIDDSLTGVTCVLRGEDHLTNTPRQLMLLQALKLRAPEYGHISMIVGDDGSPLSKRHGSRSVAELRKNGYLPNAVNNYLARLGHYYKDNQCMSLDELAAQFGASNLGRAPARYDVAQLDYWQKEVIAQIDVESLWLWMGEEVHSLVPQDKKEVFVEAVRPNIKLPHDALLWAHHLFAKTLDLQGDALQIVQQAGTDFFKAAIEAVMAHPSDFKLLNKQIKETTGAKGRGLFQPLRIAMTGEHNGPEMSALLSLMGEERIRQRFEHCLEIIS